MAGRQPAIGFRAFSAVAVIGGQRAVRFFFWLVGRCGLWAVSGRPESENLTRAGWRFLDWKSISVVVVVFEISVSIDQIFLGASEARDKARRKHAGRIDFPSPTASLPLHWCGRDSPLFKSLLPWVKSRVWCLLMLCYSPLMHP